MKQVEWIDDNGYKRISWLRDNQPLDKASEGIPNDPPDVNRIDWEQVKRDLHNAMVEKKVFSWTDVQREQNALTGIINSVIKKHLVFLFREKG